MPQCIVQCNRRQINTTVYWLNAKTLKFSLVEFQNHDLSKIWDVVRHWMAQH